MQGLIEGRVVHYVLAPEDGTWMTGAHNAAVVTRVLGRESTDDGLVNLTILINPAEGPDGQMHVLHKTAVPYDPSRAHGTWHWIERA